MRWFTADWHMGHENIIKYCDRPFLTVQSMDDALIRHVNSLLSADDELWVLGDIALGPIEDSLRRYSELVPKLVIVTGNHDRPHPSYQSKDSKEEWLAKYQELTGAYKIVNGNAIVTLSDGSLAHVSHFPRVTEDNRPNRSDQFAAFRPADDGLPVIHGHTHGLWRQRGNHLDVGVDAWGGQLVSEDTVVSSFKKQQDLPKTPWVIFN